MHEEQRGGETMPINCSPNENQVISSRYNLGLLEEKKKKCHDIISTKRNEILDAFEFFYIL